MIPMFRTLLVVVVGCIFFLSCKKTANIPSPDNPANPNDGTLNGLLSMVTPAGFNYQTEQKVRVDVTVLATDNSPIRNIPVAIWDKPSSVGGKILFRGITNNSGKLTGDLMLPSFMQQVVVDPAYIGVIRNAVVAVSSGSIFCTLGGSTGYAGNVVPDSPLGERGVAPGKGHIANRPLAVYSYLGTYDNQGKPNYLVTPNDVIQASFLENINASLPERMPVMTYHPDYLTSTAETNLHITALSDVWITFLTTH
jgi:hypothetical protein